MVVGLSTSCLQAVRLAPDAVVDFVLRTGAEGLALDDALPPDFVGELTRALAQRRDELPLWAIENVCPASRQARAQLASLERDEAEAAVAAAGQTVRLAADVGGPGVMVLLRCGEVAAAAPLWPPVRRDFLRGVEASDSAALARLRRERDQLGPRHLDALRRSLERLARIAESHGVTLGLRNPARYQGLPTPAELALLLGELQGAPLRPALDLPAAHLADVMEQRPLADTVAAWKASPLVLAADACAQIGGLPPGHGELDIAAALGPVAADARLVFTSWRGLAEAEVVQAVAALASLPRPRA